MDEVTVDSGDNKGQMDEVTADSGDGKVADGRGDGEQQRQQAGKQRVVVEMQAVVDRFLECLAPGVVGKTQSDLNVVLIG